MTDEEIADLHSLHVKPKYPLNARDVLTLVRAILAARKVIADELGMELPNEFLDPSEVRKELRRAEEVGEPIWIGVHDDMEILSRAREAYKTVDAKSTVLLDWPGPDPQEGFEEPQEDSEDAEDFGAHTISQYQTALVLLQQAEGNPLKAAANANMLAGAAEDPDDLFHSLGILIETFPFIYSSLQEAGILGGSDG